MTFVNCESIDFVQLSSYFVAKKSFVWIIFLLPETFAQLFTLQDLLSRLGAIIF